jgi:hypothetical protein
MSQVSVEVRAMAEALSLVAEAEGRPFRGHAALRASWETVLGAFQGPCWMAARLREGELGWWAFFRTEHEALEAAGLRE